MPLITKIYPTNNGEWSPGTYPPLCRVRHNGATWVNDKETEQEPSESASDWQLEARDGYSPNVTDNLESTSTTDALSANQGRVLAERNQIAITSGESVLPTSASYSGGHIWVYPVESEDPEV